MRVSISTQADSFQLADGVLAWTEKSVGGSAALKASTGSTTQTLATTQSAKLLWTRWGSGRVQRAAAVYVWSAASGQRRYVSIPTLAPSTFIAGGALVFELDGAVRRVPLNLANLGEGARLV